MSIKHECKITVLLRFVMWQKSHSKKTGDGFSNFLAGLFQLRQLALSVVKLSLSFSIRSIFLKIFHYFDHNISGWKPRPLISMPRSWYTRAFLAVSSPISQRFLVLKGLLKLENILVSASVNAAACFHYFSDDTISEVNGSAPIDSLNKSKIWNTQYKNMWLYLQWILNSLNILKYNMVAFKHQNSLVMFNLQIKNMY